MGTFHCPAGAAFYEEAACILCGLCRATTKEEAVNASRKIRQHIRDRVGARKQEYVIKKIAVCGKGGVGKSTVVSLLAKTLTEFGYRVLVIDTDESNPGLYRQFGLAAPPRQLADILARFGDDTSELATAWLTQDELSIDEIPHDFISRIDGLHFMIVGKIEDPFQGCACSMSDMMRELTLRLSPKEREMVIIDNEAGLESFGRGVEQGVDTVLTVVEPSQESVSIAEAVKYMAEGIGIARIRAIVNKVPSAEIEERLINELLERECRYLGTLYVDNDISAASLDGAPVGESEARMRMRDITRLMLDEAEMRYEE